jgi:xanthosine utilization system XapX-like protein
MLVALSAVRKVELMAEWWVA